MEKSSNRLLRKLFYRPGVKKLQSAVLFEASAGQVIGDSPLDIFLELQRKRGDLTYYWSYQKSALKNGAKIPLGAIGLRHGSRKWFKALATSKYLVNNNVFPPYFKKSVGQIYLQTWHGTPLKRFMRDLGAVQLSGQALVEMKNETDSWDFLISPSDYASKIFESAFGYRGQMLEVGSPKNDRVVGASAQTRARVRKTLGATSASILILYATSENALLNLALPRGFQLLYRDEAPGTAEQSRTFPAGVIDVTNYPDLTELLLAADVLITDYSSVMFDFAATKKPIIFFTPDIQQQEAQNALYIDLRNDAPGPICLSPAEVLDALVDLDSTNAVYESNYQAWQEKFVGLDDGGAAIRVVTRVFGGTKA